MIPTGGSLVRIITSYDDVRLTDAEEAWLQSLGFKTYDWQRVVFIPAGGFAAMALADEGLYQWRRVTIDGVEYDVGVYPD